MPQSSLEIHKENKNRGIKHNFIAWVKISILWYILFYQRLCIFTIQICHQVFILDKIGETAFPQFNSPAYPKFHYSN